VKAIMYHYVREYDVNLPKFRFLDVKNFRKQLDYFDKEFGFLSKVEWDNYIRFGVMPEREGKVLLTFDDAMSCHYDYVFPELQKRGLWGIFYVPTLPYLEGRILDVHKIHLLSGVFNGEDLLHSALQRIDDGMIKDSKRQEFRSQTYESQDNYSGVSEFKRLLNYFIDHEYKEPVLNQVSADFGYNFDSDSFYVSRQALQEMSNAGMVLGSHTNSHPLMSKLSKLKQQAELESSFSFLNKIVKDSVRTYCHPYGGFHSFNEDTVELLEQRGTDYSFNVENREILVDDWECSKQHLPRFDCNFFPHGKAS